MAQGAPTSTVFLHGFAHTHRQWHDVACQMSLNLETACYFAKLPFHEAPAAASFAEAVSALWLQVDAAVGPGEPVHLAGYSLGARLALHMALAAPERTDALLLVSAHPGLAHEAERKARRAHDAKWAEAFAAQPLAEALASFRSQPVFAGGAALKSDDRPPPTALATAAYRQRLHLDGRALAAHFAALGLAAMPNARQRLSSLPMHTTTVVGGRDAKFVALGEEMARDLRYHEHLVVPSAGHDLLWDAPGSVAEALGRLLQRASQAPKPEPRARPALPSAAPHAPHEAAASQATKRTILR